MERPKLLAVDDEPSIIYTIKKLFDLEGYDVSTANSGAQCLQELERGFKGVILLDIIMPGMDGWETIYQIKERGLHAGNSIVVFTACDTPSPRMTELQDYVNAYVEKPIDTVVLKDIVKQFTGRAEPPAAS